MISQHLRDKRVAVNTVIGIWCLVLRPLTRWRYER